jgi:hypothetical protein
MTPRDREETEEATGVVRSVRTAGATNRDGRARALETDNSIVAAVTRCRNAQVFQCARAP